MINKLQVYYQPKAQNKKMKSLSISLYDFDEAQKTHRLKIVLEKDNEKYKIKQELKTSDCLLSFLNNLQLQQLTQKTVDMSHDYFYVKCGDFNYSTNNPEDIQDVLQVVEFEKVLAYDILQYKKER